MASPMDEPKPAQSRRSALVEAASELFLEHGFEKTTLDMIIARAGGSRRTIYQAFGNKEGLFVAVLGEMVKRLLGTIAEHEAAGETPEEVLAAFGRRFLYTLTRQPVIRIFRQVVSQCPRLPGLGDAFFKAGPERGYAALADYLRRQEAAGRIALRHPPGITAALFLEMVKGDLQMRSLLYPDFTPSDAEITDRVERSVAILLHGAT